ncbi:antibiotic biosynthesis monooxygenase family protein [Aquirufa ecclesiirivi]|uniref:antibiotic biosynthesis monooxygenase family protein n=1 Tax=Aquirufa ecclesiirivi TaxID=2715124 RepID=UPI003BAE948B
MMVEIAALYIKNGQEALFESDFKTASQYIRSISGYHAHSLLKCMEQENKYILWVHWEKLEDHTIGFRQSPQYVHWKELLHHYYEPFPVVEHYQEVSLT